MSAPFANFEVSSTSNPNFSNVAYGDVMIYPGSKTQSIHIGVDRGVPAELKIAKSNVTIAGYLTATNAITTGVVTIGGAAYTGSNVTSNVYFNTNVGISDVTNLQTSLNSKLNLTGGVLTGDVFAQCNLFNNKQILANSNDTVSLPGYTWCNDTNTGIWHPADDNIGVVTNGTERMRITNVGNVGIGTSNPTAPLTIQSSGGIRQLTMKSTLSNQANEIYFDNTSNNPATQTAALGLSGDSNRNFYVWVNGTDRVNIDTNGNFGIGTYPQYKLDVAGALRSTLAPVFQRVEYRRAGMSNPTTAGSLALTYTTLVNDNSSGYFTYNVNSSIGDSITINQGGVYSIVATIKGNATTDVYWIDKNCASTVNLGAGAVGTILALASKVTYGEGGISFTGYLAPNDVVRVKNSVASSMSGFVTWTTISITLLYLC